MEEWRPVKEFPNYSVSSHGRVRNDRANRLLSISYNQQGIAQVGFSHNGRYHKRSVAVLVAQVFIPHKMGPFDTPINLDGNRRNNHVDNLMWRPRWFAVMYHKQFKQLNNPNRIKHPIINIKTNEIFEDSFVCCIHYGLLEKDLVLSILNRTYVWPTYQEFRVLAD